MDKFLEFIKNPKKKSITLLSFYIIFFLFVFILLGSNNIQIEKEEKNDDIKENDYNEIISYNYTLFINYQDKSLIYEGKFYNNKSVYTYNNSKYFYKDKTYLVDNNYLILNTTNFDVSKIFINNISTLENDLLLESTTTYKDGSIEYNYTDSSNILSNYFNILNIISPSNIKVYKSTNIDKIEVNFSNMDISSIIILYSDYNLVDDFNFDEYIIKE